MRSKAKPNNSAQQDGTRDLLVLLRSLTPRRSPDTARSVSSSTTYALPRCEFIWMHQVECLVVSYAAEAGSLPLLLMIMKPVSVLVTRSRSSPVPQVIEKLAQHGVKLILLRSAGATAREYSLARPPRVWRSNHGIGRAHATTPRPLLFLHSSTAPLEDTHGRIHGSDSDS